MRLAALVIAIALIIGVAVAVMPAWRGNSSPPAEPPVVAPPPSPPPPPPPAPPSPWPNEPELPGMVLVSIGNNRTARPQSGLEYADVVYEVLTEGGITRLLALFGSRAASEVGPVRSMRYAMVEIALGYNSPFAHAGGSQDALDLIKKLKPKSLDDIYGSGACFWRASHRKAPDNLYTSTERLVEGAKARGYELVPLVRLPGGDLAGGEVAERVVVAFSRQVSAPNVVTYEFDGQAYRRLVNDAPHLVSSGEQLAPQNLLFLETVTRTVMRQELMLDIDVVGKGRALLVRDGRAHAGTWEKASQSAQFSFKDEKGETFPFTWGQTWIHLLPDLKQVEYR
ncbi:MAG: DUF3048 domain-containing protein [Bacillota bacterium]